MLVGYARTSTVEQKASLEGQDRELRAAGCERVYAEEVSAVAMKRPKFEEAMEFLRDGDVLVVTKLDRLARSVAHLVEINERLKRKKVALKVLNNSGIDTTTATGKLMFNVIGAIAEFERELLLERQAIGIAKAKDEGKYIGRFPNARNLAADVLALHKEGVKAREIAKRLGIGKSSAYEIIAKGETYPVVPRRSVALGKGTGRVTLRATGSVR